MTSFYSLFYITIFSLFLACNSDNDDSTCYSFDERQCRMDQWASNEFGLSTDELADEIKEYFSRQGVQIDEISIDPNFHEFVCEACGVCPSGQRIFITTNSDVDLASENFDLLDLQVVSCNEVF